MKSLGIILLGTLVPILVRGQVITPESTLSAGDSFSDNAFGNAVAISGNTAVVGAPEVKAAYIFVRNGGAWTQQAKLTSGDSTFEFGISVAISGDTVVVANECSKAYVFVRSGSNWTQQTSIAVPNNCLTRSLGTGPFVAISGDTMVVGSVVTYPAEGSAYVFVHNGVSWTQQGQLIPDGLIGHYFGYSVAIAGDTAVVGDIDYNQNPKAYVFTRSGGTWFQQAVLDNHSDQEDDRFGYAVAISGNTVVVGAPTRDTSAREEHGVALAFLRNGTTWSLQATLDPHPVDEDYSAREFGTSVAISGDTVLVGTPYYYQAVGGELGSVYVFGRNGTQWQGQELVPTHTRASAEHFGWSVAIEGTTALVGTPTYYFNNTPGKVYAYDGLSVCSRFAKCDPAVVWVNFSHIGTESGCSDQPYNTLAEGVAAVPVGATLAIRAGATAAAPTISKAMRIEACGGPVTFGQ